MLRLAVWYRMEFSMVSFYSRAAGSRNPLRGKKLMFAKDRANAREEAQVAVDCLIAGEIALPSLGGFSINVEDDDDNLLFTVRNMAAPARA